MNMSYFVEGTIVDVVGMKMIKGVMEVRKGKIHTIHPKEDAKDQIIIPGLIDAHVHIESSMLVPSEFAKIAVTHGTVATVSDPHEIANVLGIEGIEFMLRNGREVPFKFFFGAPSCVPATPFESSGAVIGVKEIETLLTRSEILYLSEMMNFPGVIYQDKEVMEKLAIARKLRKPVDGHAPGLTGEMLKKYVAAGITTDHECFTLEEAREKLRLGMKVQIREGSAAKNFDTLFPLIHESPAMVMLCSDDKHPDDLAEGHMNVVVKRAIQKGIDPLMILRICTFNPIQHYNLDVGLLQPGDPADFAVIDNFEQFNILSTYINGLEVARNGKCLFGTIPGEAPNAFEDAPIKPSDLTIIPEGDKIRVIGAFDGQLITKSLTAEARITNNQVTSDVKRDILKLVVLNRYRPSKPAVAFIHGFGLKKGAIASTVAHDSHNIIAVGTTDEAIAQAINLLVESRGGISLTDGDKNLHLPLPVGGIMTNRDGYETARLYRQLNKAAKGLGSELHAPFMTLSFMALLVIPELKLSDKGLFDGNRFEFVSCFC
jgi:adenine deaminase